jgi:hypothetical protein
MRFDLRFAFVLVLASSSVYAQEEGPSRSVAGGGISVAGWTGKIDASEQKAGKTINDAKFAKEGAGFHVITGPAVTYWNPANKASGDYTVKATFNEPKYQNLNTHPHPYGIVIGGAAMGTDNGATCTARRMGTARSSCAGSVRLRFK